MHILVCDEIPVVVNGCYVWVSTSSQNMMYDVCKSFIFIKMLALLLLNLCNMNNK